MITAVPNLPADSVNTNPISTQILDLKTAANDTDKLPTISNNNMMLIKAVYVIFFLITANFKLYNDITFTYTKHH